jgi:carbamoyl-phosphate synthase large subunit
MDSATVVLSKQKCVLARMECEAVVSDHELCLAMNDKVVAHTWFTAHKLPVPIGDAYPRIVKYRFGYGSKDQFIAHEPAELHQFLRRRSSAAYLDQPLLTGQEYTVDAYVDRSGRVLAALSRKRIKVSDGEVDVSLTHRHRSILELTRRVLAIPGWRGPITLQFIDAPQGPVLIEINPRFGGGVTHSIHCGLDMPRWIIREHLERPVAPCDDWPENSVMTRCRRDFFYDNISRP